MLQDLDARQTAAQEASHLYTKPVLRADARVSMPVVLGAAAGVIALAVAGALGWHYWHKPKNAAPVQKPVKVVALVAPQAPVQPVVQAAAPVSKPQAPAVPPQEVKQAIPEPAEQEGPKAKPHAAAKSAEKKRHAKRKLEERDRARPKKTVAAAQAPVRKAMEAPARAAVQGKDESPSQKAESSYRRALSNLQDGYVNEAIASFEEALKANPRHDAARQTLVSLLIENRRLDEAMRQLQLGLTLDPRQPAMAMLLARLQIERGGNAIETLMRTLPYAGANADYHAFLAGALQRQQRHREAAEQYQAALLGARQNGVWWMGLGISLQADRRDGEALDAFRKARATGTLSPELMSFVERKIHQLGRAGG